jgi:FdhD protein
MNAVVTVHVLRTEADRAARTTDQVAAEAPLEVRLHEEPFSVIMRTPGSDRDLAAGFLYTESVVQSPDDIVQIDQRDDDVVNVTLSGSRADIVPALLAQRRQVAMNSSCGMCGRRTLESLQLDAPPLTVDWAVDAATIIRLPDILRAAQRAFAETGGLHAAGIFNRAGELLMSAEDVGRHNAVDKLLGRMLLERRLPLSDALLFVSGRSSFEIVQKAFLGGMPLVAAVSAPSSLAIELADRCGMTLIGFVRGDRFNVYAHEARVAR